MSSASPARSMPRVEQRAHQRLDVVAADAGRGERRRRRPASSRWAAGIHVTAADVAVGDDGERRRAAPRPARRPTTAARSTAASEASSGADAAGDSLDGDLGDELLALVARQHDGRRAERLGEALGERAELEEVEQPLDLGHVRLHHERLGQLDRARRGAGSSSRGSCGPAPRARRATPAASASARRRGRRCRRARRTSLISLAAVFSPTPGHAGQVVARVAAQRGVLAGTAPA